jgi:hypothetical protein
MEEVDEYQREYPQWVPTSLTPDSIARFRAVRRDFYFFTFLGSQSFFFLEVTNPHSLQRQSPGLALRIGFPF